MSKEILLTMPLVENIKTHKRWDKSICPKCGVDCWDRSKVFDEDYKVTMCTKCAFKFKDQYQLK